MNAWMLLSRLRMDLGLAAPVAVTALVGSDDDDDDDDDNAVTDRWRASMDAESVDRYWDEAIRALCDRVESD